MRNYINRRIKLTSAPVFILALAFSMNSYGAIFPNQLDGLDYLYNKGYIGTNRTAIVLDRDFVGFDSERAEIVLPEENSGYLNTLNIDNNFDFLNELKDTIQKIKNIKKFFAEKKVKFSIDWEKGEISGFDVPDDFISNTESSDLIAQLASLLSQYQDYLGFTSTGHGMKVSRVLIGENGIAPGAKIIPISTKNNSVRSTALYTDDGNEAIPISKALHVATKYSEKNTIDAINLSIMIDCDQYSSSCISQYRLFVQLLEKAAKNMLVFFSLENQKDSYFGNLPGERLIVQAAKRVAEEYRYPRIIFVVNLEKESGKLLSGKAFHAADYTLANIGTYQLPKFTNPLETSEVTGTSFASPASMAQFLLLKEYLARYIPKLTDRFVVNIMFEQADHFYKGKNLATGFYGNGFMNMSKYINYINNKIGP